MTQIVTKNLGHHVQVTTDSSNLLLWDHEVEQNTYTNGTGSTVVLAEGSVMGMVNASGKVALLTSAAVDGSQFPYGVLTNEYSVAAGATITVGVAIAGNVDSSKLVFQGADTLTTVVSGRRLRERLMADTKGLRLITSTENTKLI